MAERIIKVPGVFRLELIQGTPERLRIESDEDEDTWEPLQVSEVHYLTQFLSGKYSGGPSKSWSIGCGMRLGYNESGVYLHENHHKRYFGVLRDHASIMLSKAVPEALPEFKQPSTSGGKDSTGDLLAKLVDKMPTISDEMRKHVLVATFRTADLNKNNALSRPELGTMLRKVVGTISAKEVEEMMDQADSNDNNMISYEEFVQWMAERAPPKLNGKVKRALKTEADIVRASFRAWDKNGDGLISKKEVHFVVKKHCPDLTQQQLEVLIKTMDVDHDGVVDYDEFIDYLFHK